MKLMLVYTRLSEIDMDGEMVKCLDFVVPRWAVEANKRPTIIHFEELNRASQNSCTSNLVRERNWNCI
jgi:hypothetical protein